jgi:two-component system, NarL family, invasion response regulator UvrY
MNICLIDEDILLTDTLRILLQLIPEISDVEVYVDGGEFVERRRTSQPDLLVMNLFAKGPAGEDLLDYCREKFQPEMKIVAFTMLTDIVTIKQLLKNGANAVLSKATSYDELLHTIFQVQDGKQYIGRALQENLINSVFLEGHGEYHLSPREREVLHKVCSGQTMKEIAYDLKLSVHTVQYYHRSVMDKLKVKRTTDLVLYAIQHRLYVPEVR